MQKHAVGPQPAVYEVPRPLYLHGGRPRDRWNAVETGRHLSFHMRVRWDLDAANGDRSPGTLMADRQTDSFGLGHEPTHPPALFQAGSASETPRYWDLQGLHQLIMDVERYYASPAGPAYSVLLHHVFLQRPVHPSPFRIHPTLSRSFVSPRRLPFRAHPRHQKTAPLARQRHGV